VAKQNNNATAGKVVWTIMLFTRCISVPLTFAKRAGSRPVAIYRIGKISTSRD